MDNIITLNKRMSVRLEFDHSKSHKSTLMKNMKIEGGEEDRFFCVTSNTDIDKGEIKKHLPNYSVQNETTDMTRKRIIIFCAKGCHNETRKIISKQDIIS